MQATTESSPDTRITADTHAGASLHAYREYLDPKYRDEFDAWRGGYANPSKKHIGSKKTKNWDSAERRAGIGLIRLNDIDDAIEDVKWIAENGLRGGFLLPLPSPAEHWLRPLNHPDYDRLWAVIQDCDLVMNQHSGQGSPTYCEGQGSTAPGAAATLANITPKRVSTPLDEIPADSMCLAFQRVRAERAMADAGSVGA